MGRSDIPLNAEGKIQAIKLAAALEGIPLTAIYSSPLSRAWETAAELAANRTCTSIPVEGLTELDQGELEGQFGADLPSKYPAFYDAWKADPTDVRIPGGETLAECAERSVSAIHELLKNHTPGEPIAVVSHRMAIGGIICAALDLPVRYNMVIGQRNTAINLLSYRDHKLTLHRLNDADHLDE